MARNAEKAKAMLSRWYRLKRDIRNTTDGKYKSIPKVQECVNLQECELERQEVLKVVSKLVSDIQNAGLGEHRIRELNDEINKVIQELRCWEDRIKELGGPDYRRLSAKIYDTQGIELTGKEGYRYFGAAKDLPGVRELFFSEPPSEPKKSRTELYKNISYNYYGSQNQELQEILEEEKELERIAQEKELQRFIQDNQELVKDFNTREEILNFIKYEIDKRDDVLKRMEEEKQQHSDSEEYEQDQLEQRKQELIRQYYAPEKIHSQYVTTVEKDADLESFIRGNMAK
ncbi:unnamed protein product [Paramecium pentaurelia]|uniref:Uncharacterized protein n=1 Tax=Paramecium pentaurelia TaxID=43138 RepID=A0A8S1UWE2_9CILI|nr:unnamed protein product [Paramecium pentaurelia]